MGEIYWTQVAILTVQCIGVAAILIALYKLKNIFGLGLFYVALGLFKYVHYFLAIVYGAEIASGITVSTGSAVFFNGILFAVLFIYILDGALQARRVIYALVFLNFVFAFVQVLIHLGFDAPGIVNRLDIPHTFFAFNPRIFISGVLLILIDSFFIIYTYESVSKICRLVAVRIFCSMTVVFVLHSLFFSVLAFAGTPRFVSVLKFGLISKIIPLIVYSLVFGLYLMLFEKKGISNQRRVQGILPVIKLLTWLEKYETLVSELEMQKEAWQESEIRFGSIIEHSIEGFAMADETGKVFVWNKAMETITQIPASDVLGHNLWDVQLVFEQNLTEEREKAIKQSIQNLLKTGEAPFLNTTLEREFIRNDGPKLILSGRISAVKTLKGFMLVSVTNDISEKKLAEKELNESRQRLIDAQHLAQIGDFYWDVKTNNLICSDGLYELLKYDRNEVFTFDKITNEIHHPDDREKVTAWLNQCITKGQTKLTPFEYRLVCNDGEVINVHTEGNIYYENGQFVALFGMTQNITDIVEARKKLLESETKFRELVELAVDGILLGETDGSIIEANRRMVELTGRKKDELIGQNIKILFAEKELKEKKLRYDLLHEGQTVISQRNLIQPDGTKIPVEMHTKMMPDGTYQSIFRDISERLKAIDDIKRLNKQLLEAEKIAGLGFIEWDLINDKQFISPEIYKIYEIPLEAENPKSSIENAVYPDDKDFLAGELEKAISGEKEYRVDHRIVTSSGKTKWVNVHGQITRNQKEKAVFMMGTVLDITVQKQAINNLIESENKFRIAFTTSPDSININRLKDGMYVEVNDGFTELTGFSREETVGKTSAQISIWENLDDRARLVEALKTRGKVENMQFRFRMKDGSIKSALMSASVVSIGQVPHILSITRDISERVEAEYQLRNYAFRLSVLHEIDRAILSSVPSNKIADLIIEKLHEKIDFEMASVMLYDKSGQTAKPIAAWPAEYRDEVMSKTLSFDEIGIIDTQIIENGKTIIFDDLRKEKTASKRVKNLLDKKLYSVVLIPLISENELLGTLNLAAKSVNSFTPEILEIADEMASDLAVSMHQWKLKKQAQEYLENLEEKVAERTEQLEHSNKELRDFAQIVSHDLKAPLRAISQLSYWIATDYSDKIEGEGKQLLEMLVARVKRLDNLIEGILQYSRAGKMREKEKHIDFNILVNDVLETLEIPKNISIKIDTKLPEYVADPTRFTQLFQNLFDNAIKYNDKEQGIINIGCQKKNDFWEFYVSDNGPGIDEIYFDRIFQIFQRLTSRDKMEGTGIGLTLVKRIVQIYGGEIWLTSDKGNGTTFYFTLPVQNT